MATVEQRMPNYRQGTRELVTKSKSTGRRRLVDIEELAKTIAACRAAERHAAIERAAYFRAAARGFVPGHELEDWLAAEATLMSGLPRAMQTERIMPERRER